MTVKKKSPKAMTPQSRTGNKGQTPKSVLKQTPKLGKGTPKGQTPKTGESQTPKLVKGTPKGQTPKSQTPKSVLKQTPNIGKGTPKGQSPKSQTPALEKGTPKRMHLPKVAKNQSQTPKATKGQSPKTPKGQTPKSVAPKSDPPAKTKKLSQEIDEEMSDDEFDEILTAVKVKNEKVGKHDSEEYDDGESDEEGSNLDDEDDLSVDDDDEDEDDDEDDEDEDEDEDDDDDDEDDDDEDEEADAGKATKPVKAAVPTKIQQKAADNKKPTSKKEKETPKPAVPMPKEDIEKMHEKDARSLFIKGFAKEVTEEMIRDLSDEIIDVRLRKSLRKGRAGKRGFAYLDFKSEKIAEKNRKLLRRKTLAGRKFVVDFVGQKSAREQKKKTLSPIEMDPLKLYIVGFKTATIDELQELIPKATKIDIPNLLKPYKGRRFAFAHFQNEKDCKAAHDACQKLTINEQPLTVLFAKKKTIVEAKKRKAPTEGKQAGTKAKKQKVVAPPAKKAEEESDDDDDNDDDDDDDDENGVGDDSDSGDEDEDDDDDDDDDDEDEDDSD